MASKNKQMLEVGGRQVGVSSPDKIYFPEIGLTKLGLIEYYLAVSEGALRAIHNRPLVLKRYVKGIEGEFFFQKRAPKNKPAWVDTVTLRYPSGRSADEVVSPRPRSWPDARVSTPLWWDEVAGGDAAAFTVATVRGRSTTWTRIRVNLRNVPAQLHPPVEDPDPDYDPWAR